MDNLTNLAFLYILAGGMIPHHGFESVAQNLQDVTGESVDNLQGTGVEEISSDIDGTATGNDYFGDYDNGYNADGMDDIHNNTLDAPDYYGYGDVGGGGGMDNNEGFNFQDAGGFGNDFGADAGTGDADCGDGGDIDCGDCDVGDILGAFLEE